ncbi:MAG TPA: PA domain-containing protein [Burkholderiaceae bacterium]
MTIELRAFRTLCRAAFMGGALLFAAATTAGAATLEVINIDAPGVGFNDPTPVAPVGGNPATTLGEQRQNVFQFVANFWGKRLRSDVPIQVLATFGPLDCTATQAVLGAAGAYNVFRDFPNAKQTGTWYPSALANKLAGIQLEPNPDPFVSADIVAFFNGNLGQPGCLDGSSFYLGLDGKPTDPAQIDLLTTVLHEFGHGLGFQTFTDGETGLQFPAEAPGDEGFPSIWDHYLLDPKQHKVWSAMTDGERAASALVPRNLVWNGRTVTKTAPRVLDRGTPELFVFGGGLNRTLMIGTAQFGPPIDKKTLISTPLAVLPTPTAGGAACAPLATSDAAKIRGRIAVIDRGGCAFTVKVKNAQVAGARAVVIANNVAGTPPPDLAGSDDTITIPSVRVSKDDGAAIKAAVAAAASPWLAPFGVLYDNLLKLAGADYLNRVYLYTPNPYQGGSSVSHYDTSATPNLLMEPFAEPNQPIAVSAPKDLTLELLEDIGW